MNLVYRDIGSFVNSKLLKKQLPANKKSPKILLCNPTLFLTPGMCIPVNILQLFNRGMRVYLRGRKAAMPQ